jgi:DNA polymerase alpha subunit A
MSSRGDALKRLKAQRAASSASRLDMAVPEDEEEGVFDMVDDKTFDKIRRDRIKDDFVVDDDGLGYVDYGHEAWEQQPGDYDSDHDTSHKPKGMLYE